MDVVNEMRQIWLAYIAVRDKAEDAILSEESDMLSKALWHLNLAIASVYPLWIEERDPVVVEEEPMYEHDCTKCVFLGRYVPRNGNPPCDLYYQGESPRGESVIARYGPDGDYASGMYGSACMDEMAEAHKRALKAGLTFTPWVPSAHYTSRYGTE